MDTIETKYLGATNYRSSRIKAFTRGNYVTSVTVDYDHALSVLNNHRAAALALLVKLDWTGVSFVPGSTATGYVFVADFDRGDDVRVSKGEAA